MTIGRRLIALSVLCVRAAVLLVSVEATVFQWISTPPDYASEGQQLTGHVLTTYDNTFMVTQCSRRCLTLANCASYNFIRATNSCEINQESHLTRPQDLTFSDDAQYYLRDAYTIDKLALGPCADHPCLNGGTCLTSSAPNGGGVLAFYCFCADGWTGSTCSAKAGVVAWSDWSVWGSCSSSCGDGFQIRGRNCVDVSTGAKRSPQSCYGRDQEEQHCSTQKCPDWSPWSDWSSCVTVTGCGAGKQVRGRTCTNGGTAGVDRLCLGPINETTPCQVTACDAPIRLQEGSTYGEGRVDVYDDVTSTWLPVCADDAWTKQDGDVACAQLGLRSGSYQVVKYPMQTDVAAAQYVIVGISCSGSESRLASCHLQNWHGTNCPSGQYAGVQCIVDGRWSTWGDWGSCSVTCASGMSTRTRQCDSPPSLRGGKSCIENGTESQPCTQPPCPVDAHWDEWQEWSECSKSCESGSQSRTRDCILGKFGGSNCTGENLESQSCNTQPCPVDGVYSDWSDWSSCSATCGSGSQHRNRTCQSPLFGGSECVGEANQTQACLERNCPVDGEYSDWSDWSSCSATCGSGSQRRNRTCQSPLFGGSECVGEANQTQACLERNCPVDGVWSDWSDWGQCNVSCGGGGSSRTRICTQPQFGGTTCNGSSIEVQSCNTQSCAVDGAWKEWGSWSSCNATCGSGTKIRVRECNGPFSGGKPCPGSSQDQDFCNDDPCPVDGEWSAWSRWADCSVSCSVGLQTSYRTCSSVQNGGKLCPGNAKRNQSCDLGPCPVDCVWLGWSPWSPCNATCGGGLSWRSRSSNPELYGGAPCNGSANDSIICNTNPCPIPGDWIAWSPWSMCSVTCGLDGGQRTRTRTCNMMTYGSLTLPCQPVGGENETVKCNSFSCFPVGKDCKEYYGRGLEDNVTFVAIDPDQDAVINAPIQVLCQRDDAGVISVTIHNRMENGTAVQGSLSPGLREFKVQYIDRYGSNITIDQLIAIVDDASTTSCLQFISWKCYTAPMNSYSSTMTVTRLVYWKNRYYDSMGYWGDTTTTDYVVRANSGMTCSCGEKKTCGKTDLKCACDLSDAVWRSDSGFLTQANHLPVTTYCVTDTGNATYKGAFEVGPLICYS